MELRRTKFCAASYNRSRDQYRSRAQRGCDSLIHTVDAGMTMRLTGSLIEHLQRWIARHKMALD
jgi:hypothetical protein